MGIKVILAGVSEPVAGRVVLQAGLALARRFEAHLDVLHVHGDPRHAVAYVGEGMSGVAVQEIISAAQADEEKRSAQLRALYEAECRSAGLDPWAERTGRGAGPSASWREVTGREDEITAYNGRLSDLIVLGGRALPRGGAPTDATLEAVLLESGRPVIVLPPGAASGFGRRIVLAWNGSVEAVRAVAAAMPFLRAAQDVMVFWAEGDALAAPQAGNLCAEDLCRYLALNNVQASARKVELSGPAGEALLREALAWQADLFVMGAYTHNRYRQMIFGGVTRHMITQDTLCVMMAH